MLILLFITHLTGQFVAAQAKDPVREVKVMLETYRFSQAAILAEQYLQTDSSSIPLLLLKGKALSSGFKYREAKAELLKVISLDSTNITGWFDLVNIYRQLGNTGMALYACKKVNTLDPSNHFFVLQLSNLYYQSDQFEKAKNVLVTLYRSDTLDLYILKQLGHCYAELKKPDSAIFFYTKTLGLCPSDALITGKLINIYIKKKAFEKGLELSERFMEADSTETGILQMNAFCYYLLKRYSVSETRFLKCVAMGDDSRFTRKYLGLGYYKDELYDKAEPQFSRAYRMDTTDAEVCFYYGVSAYRSMLLDTGLAYLNKTLRLLMPSDQFLSSLYNELAGVYNELGRSDTALAILLRAREDSPGNVQYLFRIAYQYDYYLNQPTEALSYYREFLQMTKCPETEAALPLQQSPPTEKTMAGETRTIGDPLNELKSPRQYSFIDFAEKRVEELLKTPKK